MWVKPREKGYSKKWNIVKKFPGGLKGNQLWHPVNLILSGLHQHVIAEPASDDRIVHHRFVRLVLEIRLPTVREVRRWPRFELLELGGSGTNLHTSIDPIGG
jgi:hypothetical protein